MMAGAANEVFCTHCRKLFNMLPSFSSTVERHTDKYRKEPNTCALRVDEDVTSRAAMKIWQLSDRGQCFLVFAGSHKMNY